MSSDKESDLDRQLQNKSEESRQASGTFINEAHAVGEHVFLNWDEIRDEILFRAAYYVRNPAYFIVKFIFGSAKLNIFRWKHWSKII